MNTASINGQNATMDGRAMYNAISGNSTSGTGIKPPETKFATSAAEVSQNIAKSLEDTKADVQELQKLSDIVTGHKLQFNVNEELNKVIVTVVNSDTNEVIRQIPSEEIQKIQLSMKKAIGILFDEVV